MTRINQMNRRHFLRTATAASAGVYVVRQSSFAGAANEQLQLASIGVGGMGAADQSQLSGHKKVKVVALCDVDAKRLEVSAKHHPDATQFTDWREMLAKMGDKIDAVHVSTPDHTHAPATMSAIRLGKHVYCQKPLCHDVYEARQVRLAAAKQGVVTQMGIQIHSDSAYRTAVALIRKGAIGKVKQVYSWSSKRWGYDGDAPTAAPVPDYLQWDFWIGTAPMRPYAQGKYHPAMWRCWVDFGSGTMGDMGIHILDPVFSALGIRTPIEIISSSPPPPRDSFALENTVVYTFPETEFTAGPLQLTWMDGGRFPDTTGWPLPEGMKLPGQGSMFIGEDGYMLLPHIGKPQLLPGDKFKDYKVEPVAGENHWHQWANACLGEGKASANFDYAGPLTESLLLGVIANRFPQQKLVWDTDAVCITNSEQANAMVRRTYRKGWEVPGLS